LQRSSLGQARLGSWYVAPLLDNRLLDLPWVGARPGADLLGDVNTLLSRLKQGHQLGDVLALPLGLKVAGLLWDLLNNGLFLVKALLWPRCQFTARWTTEFSWNLLALSFRAVFLDDLFVRCADLFGPGGALLFSSVTLSDVFTFFLLNCFTAHNIILNFVLMVGGLALRLINGLTLLGSLSLTNKWCVTELDGLLRSNLLVVNETTLNEVLLAFLLLLRFKVSGVGGVALLAIGVLALNDVIVFGLLNHDNLVNAPLSGSSNGSDVKCHFVSLSLS